MAFFSCFIHSFILLLLLLLFGVSTQIEINNEQQTTNDNNYSKCGQKMRKTFLESMVIESQWWWFQVHQYEKKLLYYKSIDFLFCFVFAFIELIEAIH